jgi:peptidyl-dipeptidase Dcp
MVREMSLKLDFNPEIFVWNGQLGLPCFEKISDTDFGAAFAAALPAHLREIEAIANNPDQPNFENTVLTFERSGEMLARASGIFQNLTNAHTNDELQALERALSADLSRHRSKIMMNRSLFARVDTLYQSQRTLGLDDEAKRVLDLTWKLFVRSGAKLAKADQARLASINERLATLGTVFSQNVLADEREPAVVLETDEELAGVPSALLSAMRAAADERGHANKYAVTSSRSIIEPFLAFSERRDLREVAFKAWATRGETMGSRDNRPIVAKIVRLRAEKAALLGYASFAHFKLDDTMAKTPENVRSLLETVWEKARGRAAEETEEITRLILADGQNHPVEPWDWRHYSQKVRAARYAFDEAEVKPYLQLDKMIDATFHVANTLFGLRFRERLDAGTYHPDVRVFEVLAADGVPVGVFLGDYFARPSKRSGAWMSSFQDQHRIASDIENGGQTPIVVNVMNFAKPPAGEPVLITMADAKTLFHEFGHALHGLLSNVTYPSISGTSVSRDFVELPSQLYEHWLTVPEVLRRFAVHYQTGEALSDSLLEKMRAAGKFNKGFSNVEFIASALVDMAFHSLDPEQAADIDPMAFQSDVLSALNMPPAIVMRHATPHFSHVFSGDGYSAGYYSYMWSGVLDADAFQAFLDAGDPFDSETAAKLKRFIYSSGGSMDPEAAYIAFRGKLPSAGALLEKEGLA